jgi:hypothetical protein
MLQNSRFTGHASTQRNEACGTYKEEVAGSNPASPTRNVVAKNCFLHCNSEEPEYPSWFDYCNPDRVPVNDR